MTVTPQRAFSGGILSPGMYERRDIPKWMTGLKDADNVQLRVEGGAENRAGFEIVTGFDTSTDTTHQWLLPFTAAVGDSYVLEFTDTVMRPIRNGAYLLDDTFSDQSVVGLTVANPARLEMVNNTAASNFTVGRLVYFADPAGDCALHTAILKVTAISGEFITFEIVGGTTIDNTGDDWGSIGAGATLQEVYQTTTPYSLDELPDVQFTQDVDTMFLAHPNIAPQKLVRTSDTDWAFSALTFQPSIAAPGTVITTATTGSGSTSYSYAVSAIDAETGEESLAEVNNAPVTNDLTTAGNINTVTWSAVSGAGQYKVYRLDNGIFGFIGNTASTTFVDNNITPNTADNIQAARDPFSGAGNRPSVTAFVEQRLTFAATNNNPQAVEMSNNVAPLNFNRALTPGVSDAISFRMRSQELNRVLHIIDGDRPLIFTAGGEWYMETQDRAPLASGNFALRNKTRRGSASKPMPVVVGETVMHVDRSGNTLREFSLDVNRDTPSADLTVLSRQLFKAKRITSIAYAQSPNSIVWLTTAAGDLYSMTYMQEHEVWGWTKHTAGGADAKVLQVCVVPEGSYDTPYFVVERVVDGLTIRLVERLAPREATAVEDCYFVDAGYHVTSGTAFQNLRGFLHLRGEAVSVLGDGNVIDDVVVSATGTVDLGLEVNKASIGMGYRAFITSLPMDLGDQIQGLGSSLGRYMSTSEIAISVVDTRGIAVGLEGGEMSEVVEFTGQDPIPLSTKTHVVSIDGDWQRDISVTVEQNYPLPMTVTALGPKMEIEDGT